MTVLRIQGNLDVEKLVTVVSIDHSRHGASGESDVPQFSVSLLYTRRFSSCLIISCTDIEAGFIAVKSELITVEWSTELTYFDSYIILKFIFYFHLKNLTRDYK